MRLIPAIACLLLGILALLLLLLVTGSPAGDTGLPHSTISGMSVGGDGLARLGGMGWALVLIQILALLLIHALIALGVSSRHRDRQFWLLLGIGCAISLGIWWAIYSSYIDYLESGTTVHILGFPLATTLMLFGVFLGGSYLCGLYIWGFRRYILTDEDEQAYESLRARSDTPRRAESVTGGDR